MSIVQNIQFVNSVSDAHAFFSQFKTEYGKLTIADRKKTSDYLDEMKKKIKPKHPDTNELIKLYHESKNDEVRRNLMRQYINLEKEMMDSAEGKEYVRVCGEFDNIRAEYEAHNSRSNRAGRAKNAEDVFNACAGKGKIFGAKVDAHGNAIGTEYDLGRDGSYAGCEVVILQQYCRDFKGTEFTDALRQKGFKVIHHYGITPSVEELKASLETASQLWLISTNTVILTNEHISVIINFWKKGLGLYILGDNDPFYVDANRVLNEISHELFKENTENLLKMSGNSPGDQTVSALSNMTTYSDIINGGFMPHIICTGLQKLYEGITVAFFNENNIKKCEFEPILYDHCNKLVTAYRPAKGIYGPIIIDGAFTRLYYSWQYGGTARYVRNCACILSTIVPEEKNEVIELLTSSETEVVQTELDYTNSFNGTCAITYDDDVPISLLCTSLVDSEQNTSDFALNNPLALHYNNKVICGQPINSNTAQIFLNQGEDPFTRRKVMAVLPLVDLSNKFNLNYVTLVANKLFMNGRAMNRYALNILLAVLEEMLLDNPDCPDGIKFMINQLLKNTKSAANMTTVGGATVPLYQGLLGYVDQPGFANISKIPSFVFRVARIINQFIPQSADDLTLVKQMVRRSWIKMIMEVFIALGKKNTSECDYVSSYLDNVLYDLSYNIIPIEKTIKTVNLETNLSELIEKYVFYMPINQLFADAKRTAKIFDINDGNLITDNELTMLCLILSQRARFSWLTGVEKLLTDLMKSSQFKEIWDNSTIVTFDMVKKYSDEIATVYHEKPDYHNQIPKFVTPFGPSVWYCSCGYQFGDYNKTVTHDYCVQIKYTRTDHFSEVYGTDINGYPTKTSSSFSLHRAVQVVLTSSAFRLATDRTYEMELKVAEYLKNKSKGNIHTKDLANKIQIAIDSYLECRKMGMDEPLPGCRIEFEQKLLVEQKLLKNKTK